MGFRTGKTVRMSELVKFCDEYNSTGYGKARIIELKSYIIVELYNAGWSDNESMDNDFHREFPNCIIYNRHPMTIAEFRKDNLLYNTVVVGIDNPDGWGDCYSKQDKYTYEIEIES